MNQRAHDKNDFAVRVDTDPDLGLELRQLAAKMPGLKVTTLARMAIRAGLPLVRAQLIDGAAQLAADDGE